MRVGAHFPKHGKTVHFGHEQIEQHDRGSEGLEQIERAAPVFCRHGEPALAFDQPTHHEADGRIVLDHQNGGLLPLRAELVEDRQQLGAVHGLDQIVGGTEGDAGGFQVVHHGEEDDRDGGQLGVGLELGEKVPAIDFRHEGAENDDIGMKLLRAVPALLAGHADDQVALPAEQLME